MYMFAYYIHILRLMVEIALIGSEQNLSENTYLVYVFTV